MSYGNLSKIEIAIMIFFSFTLLINLVTKIQYTVKFGATKRFGHPKIVPYSYEVNWQICHGKWFLIKPFIITKFDCTIKSMNEKNQKNRKPKTQETNFYSKIRKLTLLGPS